MADVVIRVGAALDVDPDTLFEPLVRASKRAAAKIKKAFDAAKGDSAAAGAAGSGGSGGGSGLPLSDSSRVQQNLRRVTEQRAASAARALAKEEAGIAAEQKITAAKERLAAAIEKQAQRADASNRRSAKEPGDRAASAAARDALAAARKASAQPHAKPPSLVRRLGGAAASVGARFGHHLALSALQHGMVDPAMWALKLPMQVANAAGFDFDPTAGVGKSVKLQSSLLNLSNQAWIPSDRDENGKPKANAKYVAPEDIMARMKPMANAAGYEYQEATDALSAFVGKTGELNTGLDVFNSLAKLSRATGTNLQDMVSAAADVSTALGDIPNKGAAIDEVMRSIAGQGKVGAVEIKDLAHRMGLLAAVAPHYSVKDAQGNESVSESLKMLGGFAQIIRRSGGKATAAQTVTSVDAMFNQFSKNARLKAFERHGVKAILDNGKIRDPREIIKDMLGNTAKYGLENQRERLGEMFGDQRAKPIVTALSSVFNDAYLAKEKESVETFGQSATEAEKIAAGKAAVQAEFDRMNAVSMSAAEVDAAFRRAAGSTEAASNRWKNSLTETGDKLRQQFMTLAVNTLPAVERGFKVLTQLTDSVLQVYKGMLAVHDPEAYAKLSAMTDPEGRIKAMREDQLSDNPVMNEKDFTDLRNQLTQAGGSADVVTRQRTEEYEKQRWRMTTMLNLGDKASDEDISKRSSELLSDPKTQEHTRKGHADIAAQMAAAKKRMDDAKTESDKYTNLTRELDQIETIRPKKEAALADFKKNIGAEKYDVLAERSEGSMGAIGGTDEEAMIGMVSKHIVDNTSTDKMLAALKNLSLDGASATAVGDASGKSFAPHAQKIVDSIDKLAKKGGVNAKGGGTTGDAPPTPAP